MQQEWGAKRFTDHPSLWNPADLMGFWMLRNVFSPIYVKCHHLSSNANSLKSLKLAVFFFFFFKKTLK